MDDEPSWMGPALAIGYLVLAAGWVVVVIGLTSLGLTVYAPLAGVALETLQPEQILDLMGARGIAIMNMLQTLGMAALALASWLAVARAARISDGWRRAIPVFALTRASRAGFACAVLGGLSVGLFPAWVAEQVREGLSRLGLLPDVTSLDLVARLLNSPDVVGKLLMGAAVVVVAPVCEELVFRGYLWDALARFLPNGATWVVTSVLFGVMHLDPIQGSAVFFTGLFLGWLRWWTGSLGPAVTAHFVNNALAAVVATTATGPAIPMPLPLAFAGGLITAALSLALWWVSRREVT